MITVKQLWEALDSPTTYEALSPDELARLDKAHAQFLEMFSGDARRKVLCYIEHKNCHMRYVVVEQETMTYQFHEHEMLHALNPESQENSVEFLHDTLPALRAMGYTQVLA